VYIDANFWAMRFIRFPDFVTPISELGWATFLPDKTPQIDSHRRHRFFANALAPVVT
jgi:hypothetical protein